MDEAENPEQLAARIARVVRPGVIPPVIVMRGAAGTGKSVLAAEVARLVGGVVISSDVVRKQMLGMAPTARPDETERAVVYGGPMHARTYAALLARGRTTLLAGRAAILDATYLRRESRREVQAMAQELGAPYVVLDVTCDPEVVRERLLERAVRDDDASDADWAVYEAQVAEADPIGADEEPFRVTVRSGDPPEHAVAAVIASIERQWDARA
jgi:predicted kinase